MGARIVLRGITWNHSRGFVSVVATAQRFSEMQPQVDIIWEKRSLQEFADAPIQGLAEQYDLLVIDHPWAGYAAHSQALLPLQEIIPADLCPIKRRIQWANHTLVISSTAVNARWRLTRRRRSLLIARTCWRGTGWSSRGPGATCWHWRGRAGSLCRRSRLIP